MKHHTIPAMQANATAQPAQNRSWGESAQFSQRPWTACHRAGRTEKANPSAGTASASKPQRIRVLRVESAMATRTLVFDLLKGTSLRGRSAQATARWFLLLVLEPRMLKIDRQTAFGRILALIFPRPGSSLGRRPIFAATLVASSPCFAQALHVAVRDAEEPVLRTAVAAPGGPSVVSHGDQLPPAPACCTSVSARACWRRLSALLGLSASSTAIRLQQAKKSKRRRCDSG